MLRQVSSAQELREKKASLQPGSALTFGRSSENDIPITDPEKRVSTRHGRIECRPDGQLYAVDGGSLNGTYHQGAALDQSVGARLADGDILRICDFELQVFVTQDAGLGGDELDATMSLFDPAARCEIAARRLESLYSAELHHDQPLRLEALQTEVRRAVADLPPHQATLVMRSLVKRFAGQDDADKVAVPTAAEDLGDASAAVLRGMATRLVPDSSLRTAADVKRFAALLQQFVDAAIGWLARSLQSRSVFAQEFGAEVTAMFQRTENPLKGLGDAEVAKYLMDWSNPAPESVRQHYLDAVLQDLAEHQLGILAGVREAVANVVAQLSPARVMTQAQNDRSWSLASRSARAWETYEKMYAELFEERGKLFNDVISPGIQQGYLQQHQRADDSGGNAGSSGHEGPKEDDKA